MSTAAGCPLCGGTLVIDATAQAESVVFVQGRGAMPYLDRRRRPAVVTFCTCCEYAIEHVRPRHLNLVQTETMMAAKTPKTTKTTKTAKTPTPIRAAKPVEPSTPKPALNVGPIYATNGKSKPAAKTDGAKADATPAAKPAREPKPPKPAGPCSRCGRTNSHGGDCRTREACDKRAAQALVGTPLVVGKPAMTGKQAAALLNPSGTPALTVKQAAALIAGGARRKASKPADMPAAAQGSSSRVAEIPASGNSFVPALTDAPKRSTTWPAVRAEVARALMPAKTPATKPAKPARAKKGGAK